MKNRKLPAFILAAILLLLSLCGCGSKNTDSENLEETLVLDGSNESGASSTTNLPSSGNLTAEKIVFGKNWDYEESFYSAPTGDARAAWDKFKEHRDAGAPTDELLSILSGVTVNDKLFVPGFVEYSRYYLIHFNETGDTSSSSNAMNVLTEGYANTGDSLFLELKEDLGWSHLSEIINHAEEALKQRDSASAFEIINTLPDRYFSILEATRIIRVLNDFNDAYYYLIMGHTLGHQYIVHFQIDGTYERVRMNEDGVHDSGTWELSMLEDWDIRFADLQFQGSSGSYFRIEYDSNYNPYEYTLNINKDGHAKEQFEYIAGLGSEPGTESVSGIVSALIGSKWQVDEGWYYKFNADGTGIISMVDDSYSYNFTYSEHPERENAVIITPSDVPDDYTWIYDPANDTFTQESYGFDMNTNTSSVFYMDVYVYNG